MEEELAKARRDGDAVDIYKHRRRYRLFKAVLLGASLAGLTALIMAMIDGKRNPCERVHNYLCQKDPVGLPCKSYAAIVDESKHGSSPEMRSNILSHCQSQIERLKAEYRVEGK